MRKIITSLIIFSSLIGGLTYAQSNIDPMNLPKLTGFVTDFSNVLESKQLDELKGIAKNYETQTTNQLVAVLFPNRNGNELFDIGMKIWTENQIGQKGKNNGLLLVISTDEKKIRIMIGYGLEWMITDALANRMIENDIRPYVNSGDWYSAVNNFYTKSMQIISWDVPAEYRTNDNKNLNMDSDYLYIVIFLWFIIGGILKSIINKKTNKKKNKIKTIISSSLGILWFVFLAVWITFLWIFLLLIVFGLLMWGNGIFWWGWFGRGGFGWWGGWWWFSGGWGWFGWWGAGD